MPSRIDYRTASPDARRTLLAFQAYVNNHADLDPKLLALIDIRASQINGCAFCLDMHAKEARERGESQRRLDLLPAWRECEDEFTPRERAALAWTEALTLVAVDHVPDAVYEEARREFNEQELIALTVAILAINTWNRVNVAFRTPPGAK